MRTSVKFISVLIAASLLAAGAQAADKNPPQTTHDGLELRQVEGLQTVYLRPGVTFDQYKRLAILDCPVAFRKNWQRNQNETSPFRVTAKDMERMKSELSAEFRKIFVEELQNKGGYEVVDTGGEDVLVLRPAIVDLDITAPDTMAPGRNYTFSASTGRMTLYLEIYDSVTSQIIGRVIDTQAARDSGLLQWQTRVTNMSDADRALRKWAAALRDGLDRVHGKAPAKR